MTSLPAASLPIPGPSAWPGRSRRPDVLGCDTLILNAVNVDPSALDASPKRSTYRRSSGSRRGEVRRQQLLERVTDDLAVNGLVDFSLRRAAKAAGTTHKVLLYHFDGADDLLVQAILRLRERRIDKGLAAATEQPSKPDAGRSGAGGVAGPGGGGVAGARPGHRPDDVRHGAVRRTRAGRVAAVPAVAVVPVPGRVDRSAETGGRPDDPGRPARIPDRPTDQRRHRRESTPGSRPWLGRWTGRRPPPNNAHPEASTRK